MTQSYRGHRILRADSADRRSCPAIVSLPRRCRIVPLVLATALAAIATPAHARGPTPHADPLRDIAGGPLDLTSVTLGQQGTDLILRMTTAGEWRTDQLSTRAGHALCLRLFYGRRTHERVRVCVINREGEPGLRYSQLDGFARARAVRPITGLVWRPDERTIEAAFSPADAGLNLGRYQWQAESRWTDQGACARLTACTDRAPGNGYVPANVRSLVEPRCFGAASRNPAGRCENPDLRLSVVPAPADAVIAPNARCVVVDERIPYTCSFGVRLSVAQGRIALVGDSHAAHWRGALEVLAQARRLRGMSLTRAGCPFSTAPASLPKRRRQRCKLWNRAVRDWFTKHPSVHTVFLGQQASVGVITPRGRSEFEAKVAGYIDAWRRLPASVKAIVVLRDTPRNANAGFLCVQRALAARHRADEGCAVSRSRALRRDPAVDAARQIGSRRVHVVNLTRFFCSARRCFPVVGGALVHKDATHMTDVFSATLGPFLLRRVSRFLRACAPRSRRPCRAS